MKKALSLFLVFTAFAMAVPAPANWRLVVMGPANSGKGTVATALKDEFGIPILAGSQLVKDEMKLDPVWAAAAAAKKDGGDLLPDTPEYMGRILAKAAVWLAAHRDKFIIDGIPRTEWQARELARILKELGITLDAAVEVNCGLPTVKLRASGRLQCPDCGVSYHRDLKPPVVVDTCDRCACKLRTRADDEAEKVEHRYKDYETKRVGIVDFYRAERIYLPLDGEKGSQEVVHALLAHLRKK